MSESGTSSRTQLHCTGACGRIGEQLGVNPEALRTWVKRAEIDEGLRRAPRQTMQPAVEST